MFYVFFHLIRQNPGPPQALTKARKAGERCSAVATEVRFGLGGVDVLGWVSVLEDSLFIFWRFQTHTYSIVWYVYLFYLYINV